MRKITVLISFAALLVCFPAAEAAYRFSDYRARPPIHVYGAATAKPTGLSPDVVKKIYRLPARGGSGTIAIIGAYHDVSIEKDLADFSNAFHLPPCTARNGCFAVHEMSANTKGNSGWSMEITLDVEWAHAIAPDAKILLVEAATPGGANLLKAVDYAAARNDVVAVSMSWGGAEFPEETKLDNHFISANGAAFFASSGDNGWGASWPAASPNVVAVGGSSLSLGKDASLKSENAWAGSGGGVSAYEKAPAYQTDYAIPRAHGMRAIPDVSYDADPHSGFSIVRNGIWRVVGGTSAGAPQWAAIRALGGSASNEKFYADKNSENATSYFRDIVSGANGNCSYYCKARKHYDYITGLGSPLTVEF